MTLEFYVNLMLALIGTGWGLVWLVRGLSEVVRDLRYRREQEIREVMGKHCSQKADAVRVELKMLEEYMGIRYGYNKDLNKYWFEEVPPTPTYRDRK